MTDKTGILLALAKEIRDGLGNDATASMRRRWAIELEALAEQPAGAVGEQPAEGAQGEADYWRGRAIVAERRNAVTPSAASVDVDAILEKLKDRVFQNHECPAESAAVWNTALYEMKGLIDSAGGAKGGLTDKAIMAAWRAMADELEADPDTECGAMRARQLRDCARELQSREELFGTSTTQPAECDGAVVPDAERRHIERAIRVLRRDYESPLADAVESIYKQSLAAAPAAPKGGVVEVAARALVAKIEAIHADPAYQGVWLCAHNHGVPYTGPKYDKELAALTAALATGEQP